MSTCTKVKRSKEQALREVSFARRHGNTWMTAYQCKTCRADSGERCWHIGRSLPRKRWMPGKAKRKQR